MIYVSKAFGQHESETESASEQPHTSLFKYITSHYFNKKEGMPMEYTCHYVHNFV